MNESLMRDMKVGYIDYIVHKCVLTHSLRSSLATAELMVEKMDRLPLKAQASLCRAYMQLHESDPTRFTMAAHLMNQIEKNLEIKRKHAEGDARPQRHQRPTNVRKEIMQNRDYEEKLDKIWATYSQKYFYLKIAQPKDPRADLLEEMHPIQALIKKKLEEDPAVISAAYAAFNEEEFRNDIRDFVSSIAGVRGLVPPDVFCKRFQRFVVDRKLDFTERVLKEEQIMEFQTDPAQTDFIKLLGFQQLMSKIERNLMKDYLVHCEPDRGVGFLKADTYREAEDAAGNRVSLYLPKASSKKTRLRKIREEEEKELEGKVRNRRATRFQRNFDELLKEKYSSPRPSIKKSQSKQSARLQGSPTKKEETLTQQATPKSPLVSPRQQTQRMSLLAAGLGTTGNLLDLASRLQQKSERGSFRGSAQIAHLDATIPQQPSIRTASGAHGKLFTFPGQSTVASGIRRPPSRERDALHKESNLLSLSQSPLRINTKSSDFLAIDRTPSPELPSHKLRLKRPTTSVSSRLRLELHSLDMPDQPRPIAASSSNLSGKPTSRNPAHIGQAQPRFARKHEKSPSLQFAVKDKPTFSRSGLKRPLLSLIPVENTADLKLESPRLAQPETPTATSKSKTPRSKLKPGLEVAQQIEQLKTRTSRVIRLCGKAQKSIKRAKEGLVPVDKFRAFSSKLEPQFAGLTLDQSNTKMIEMIDRKNFKKKFIQLLVDQVRDEKAFMFSAHLYNVKKKRQEEFARFERDKQYRQQLLAKDKKAEETIVNISVL